MDHLEVPGSRVPDGGTALGLALFVSYTTLRYDLLIAWLAWMIVFDGPHAFAMYTRTYLSRDERAAHRSLLTRSLAIFLIGPLALVACTILHRSGFGSPRMPITAFTALATTWSFWHVLRQHHGIARLYERKDPGHERIDAIVDGLFLQVGITAPYLAFFARHPEVRLDLGLPAPLDHPPVTSFEGLLSFAAVASVGLVAIAWIARQAFRVWSGRNRAHRRRRSWQRSSCSTPGFV